VLDVTPVPTHWFAIAPGSSVLGRDGHTYLVLARPDGDSAHVQRFTSERADVHTSAHVNVHPVELVRVEQWGPVVRLDATYAEAVTALMTELGAEVIGVFPA
jgi:hypothetical protein